MYWFSPAPSEVSSSRISLDFELRAADLFFRELVVPGLGRIWFVRQLSWPLAALALYESLSSASEGAAVLCGRDAIQISPAQPTRINFSSLAERLRRAGEVKFNEYLLRFKTGKFELTVFQDARSIIRGTDEIAVARSLYAKYIGT